MGATVRAICKCGFKKDALIGGSRQNYKTTELFPCLCSNCNNMVDGNLKSKVLTCPDCNSKNVTPYNNEKLITDNGNKIVERSFDNVLTDGFHLCPKCNEPKLRFFSGGIIWD
ncbi:hypothetical protein [Seonamhaeicola sp. ML3]|uniref:hypothetical protein n=1 Tax=Seonamhaeicola sp. ML3 TaxID=2937786 RepID=UPI00200FF9E6|nr:hypothetical protein [Seonamhaeicola sp. ML3]